MYFGLFLFNLSSITWSILRIWFLQQQRADNFQNRIHDKASVLTELWPGWCTKRISRSSNLSKLSGSPIISDQASDWLTCCNEKREDQSISVSWSIVINKAIKYWNRFNQFFWSTSHRVPLPARHYQHLSLNCPSADQRSQRIWTRKRPKSNKRKYEKVFAKTIMLDFSRVVLLTHRFARPTVPNWIKWISNFEFEIKTIMQQIHII